MGLAKYIFAKKEKLPAENVCSINPDSVQPQASGFLTGGINPSIVSVFTALARSGDNGKFKINIDGIVWDNISPQFLIVGTNTSMGYAAGADSYTGDTITGTYCIFQTFTVGASDMKLTTGGILGMNANAGNTEAFIATTVANAPAVVLGTVVAGNGDYSNTGDFTSLNIVLSAGVKYAIGVRKTTGSANIRNNSLGGAYKGVYSGGVLSGMNAWGGINFTVNGQPLTALSTSLIASQVQAAIRAVTGKTETVAYSTNKYIITSSTLGRASKILKLMTPSAGTDISGNNATLYLDCGNNAIESAGTGEEYNLPRLNNEGVLAVPIKNNMQVGTTYTLALIDAFKYVVLTNASAIAVTIPTNSVVAFPIGTEIYLIQGGAGKVTLSGAGVTINSLSSYKSIAGAGGQATLIKIATDTWQLYGNLIA